MSQLDDELYTENSSQYTEQMYINEKEELEMRFGTLKELKKIYEMALSLQRDLQKQRED